MIKLMLRLSFFIIAISHMIFALATTTTTRKPEDFSEYIYQIKTEALLKGLPPELIERTFDGVQYQPRIIESDKNQPEKKQTLSDYLNKVVTPKRVEDALQQMQKQQGILALVSQRYAVQPQYIVALWGLESNFGQIQGKENIISALATLAFDGRRETFFKEQLFILLDLLNRNIISSNNLRGSWAGAMGQSQFMPSSLLRYGVDADADGLIDIWDNTYDVLGSIANYLSTEGWNANAGWGVPVTLSRPLKENLFGIATEQSKSVKAWMKLGVKPSIKPNSMELSYPAWLIKVQDTPESYFLVYNNFRVLMHWNRSYYFALSVAKLADFIAQQNTVKSH